MRESWLDNAKALAITLVVFGHCLTSVEGYTFFQKTDVFIYGFHMPLFFALSGYSFALIIGKLKKNKDIKYFVKHLINIAVLYISFSALYVVLNMLLKSFVHVHTEIEWSYLYLMLIKPVAHYWYLYILFFMYLAGLLFVKIFSVNDNPLIKIIVMLILFALTFLSPKLKYVNIWEFERICKMLFFFEAGYLFSEYGIYVARLKWLLLSLAVLGTSYCYLLNGSNVYILLMFAAVMTFTVFTFVKEYFNKDILLVSYVGRNCLFVFIFHSYFTSVMSVLCEKVFPGAVVIRVLMAFLSGMAGPLIMCYLYNGLIKKIKGTEK